MRKGYFLVLLVVAALSAGCKSTCASVCERWSECVGTPIGGVDACSNQCAAKADSDAVYRGRVENCLSCSEPLVCSEAVKSCSFDCTIAVIH
jgi:hypothetical protein